MAYVMSCLFLHSTLYSLFLHLSYYISFLFVFADTTDLVIKNQKCNLYTAGFKLKVIPLKEKSNNYAASCQFRVYKKLICDWHKNIAKLENIPKSEKDL